MEFIEIEIWKFFLELLSLAYELIDLTPNDEIYSLKKQVMLNKDSVLVGINELVDNQSNRWHINFLYEAKEILRELEVQLSLSFDLGYVSEEYFEALFDKLISSEKRLNDFINYYEKIE